MSENDFMVAIQAVLSQALTEGWPVERIVDAAHEAVEEFETMEFEAEHPPAPNASEEGSDAE